MTIANWILLSSLAVILILLIISHILKKTVLQKICECLIIPLFGALNVLLLRDYLPDSRHLIKITIIALSLSTISTIFLSLEKIKLLRISGRILILANPHNPVGITWPEETLRRLAHFAATHNLIVISDEIHCDMALFGHKHIPFASVSEEAANCSITFSAPSKTFNIAGIVSSWAVVPNDELRKQFYGWMAACELNEEHLFAPIATMAAFEHGESWRQQMLTYLEGNIDFVVDYCRKHIPELNPLRPQASYLLWLDCRALGLSHTQLLDLFINKAHLALNDGEMFGIEGHGCMRMNVGCPRSMLEKAMKQLETAIKNIRGSE